MIAILFDSSNYEYWSIIISRPLVLILLYVLNSAISKYPILLEYVNPLLLVLFGILFTLENIKNPYPKFFELWHFYHFFCFIITIVQCIHWK